jgi:hypothetical protein
VHKARALKQPERLGNWLYGVAYRVAMRARTVAARRQSRQRQGVEMVAAKPEAAEIGRDEQPLVHEELTRLPEKYRVPMVLCYLQGKSHEEAARLLEWPLGTVKGRLARARDLLRNRLLRRGVTLSAAGLAAWAAETTVMAAVPNALAHSTTKAALLVAAGQSAAAGMVSMQAAALTRGVLQTMFLCKLRSLCLTICALGVVGTGAGLCAYHTLRAESPQPSVDRLDEPAAATSEERAQPTDDGTAEDRQENANNLKRLALAMHNYHDANGSFPPAAVVSNDGKSLLSWRVLLLPYLDENKLFQEFKLDEPWDGKHNKGLLARMPKVFAPVRGKTKEKYATYYQVFTGEGTVFPGMKPARIADITDGTSNTVLLVEAGDAVPWTKPADLTYDANKPLPKLGAQFKSGFHLAFADGSVHFAKRKFNERMMRLLILASDGNVVNHDDVIQNEP